MKAPFQLPRALAVTAAMFSLAAGAHVLAGGTMPAPSIMAALLAMTLLPVMLLARIRLCAPIMATLLGSGQLLLHEAFDRLSSATGFTPAPGAHVHGLGMLLSPTAAGMGQHAPSAPGVLMLMLHTAATVATAVLLARGETAVWALAAWLRPLVRLLMAPALHPLPRPAAPAAVFVPPRWRNLRLPALRGPPHPAAP